MAGSSQERTQGANHAGQLIEKLLSEPRRLIVTILIANEFVNVAASVIFAAIVIKLFGAENKLTNLFVMVPILLPVGEITPKTLAIRHNLALARVQSLYLYRFVLRFFSYLFYPILIVFSSLARLLSRLLGGGNQDQNPFTRREEIRSMVQMSSDQGDIEPMEQRMIRRLFNFGESTAREVMMPLIDVSAVDANASCGEAVRVATSTSHARIRSIRRGLTRSSACWIRSNSWASIATPRSAPSPSR